MATVKEKKITVATKEVKAKPVKKSSVKPSNISNNIDLKARLHHYFGFDGFKYPQEDIIKNLFSTRSLFFLKKQYVITKKWNITNCLTNYRYNIVENISFILKK